VTTDAFLVWVAAQPKEAGRFELIDGMVVTLQSERLVQGATRVRISTAKSYQPDALVYCGARKPPDVIEIDDPNIVCEILSPDSIDRDHGEKLEGYFSLPGVHHYLIVDPDRRTVIHHRRGPGEDIIRRICKQGDITLDPPGIAIRVADLFERDAA
jgi:Uma2 family endonuclease